MKPSASEVWTLGQRRSAIQWGGPLPTKPAYFSGIGSQRVRVEGISIPDGGGIEPIWMPDPRRARRFVQAGQMQSPPELPEGTLVFAEELGGGIPRHLARLGCFNLYEMGGPCSDLSDLLAGWQGHLMIYENGRSSGNKDAGNRTAYEADDMLETSVPVVFDAIYPIGELFFGEQAGSQIDREVIDAVYGAAFVCDDCDPDQDTQRIYVVTKSSGSGSPGLPAEVLYSLDGGRTWTEVSITGIGASEDPVALDIVGDKLVVLTRTAGSATSGGYYWATVNQNTGIPGSWTKVTSGFAANKQPNDIYVEHSGAIYFCGDGGYIYRSTDITAGVEVLNAGAATTVNLLRIKGLGQTIVAVGQASTVIRSLNGGTSFGLTTDSTPSDIAVDLTAVDVLGPKHYWVGSSNSGRLFYTLNGGESWVEKSFAGAGNGDIKDIVFVTPSVGYFAHNDSSPAGRLFTTWDGGRTWTNAAPRVGTIPTNDYIRRIAVPMESDETRACNNVVLAGLGGNGTDGFLAVGAAPMR